MSASVEELELDEDGLDEDDGVLLEPAPAAPPLVLELGEELDDAPPLAGLLVVSLELEDELDGEDELAPGVVEPEDDALPDGELEGELVVPLDDDDEPEGDVVEPEGEVDELEPEPPRSHAVISDAPSARETATASVESLMWPPWLGYEKQGARIGPSSLFRNRETAGAGTVPLVLHGGLRVAALGTRAVAATLEVAMLVGLFRVDLALNRVGAVPLVRGCRISNVGGCRAGARSRRARLRHAVGFR